MVLLRKKVALYGCIFAAENEKGKREKMNKCLCYSKEKGLYKSYVEKEQSESILIQEHSERGYLCKKAKQHGTILDRSMDIYVNTNFGYPTKSYFFFRIEVNGQKILNFKEKDRHRLFSNPLDEFHVEIGNWDELFNGIIGVYNNLYFYCTEREIEDCFNIFDQWGGSGKFSSTSSIGSNLSLKTSKLIQLIAQINQSIYKDNAFVTRRLVLSCKKLINVVGMNYDDIVQMKEDTKIQQALSSLHKVHDYLEQHDSILGLIGAYKDCFQEQYTAQKPCTPEQ